MKLCRKYLVGPIWMMAIAIPLLFLACGEFANDALTPTPNSGEDNVDPFVHSSNANVRGQEPVFNDASGFGGGAPGCLGMTMPPVTDYSANGPFATTTVNGTGPGGQYTVVRPKTLGKNGFIHPVATWVVS